MITIVGGARPNWPKVAPIWRELERRGTRTRIIHTDQHEQGAALDVYDEMGLPAPHCRLGKVFVHHQESHAMMTARVMTGVEQELITHRPDWLVVVGDVNSTLGAALAAVKLGVKIAHVEAGLRSGDWSMPEEINRTLVDLLSTLMLCTEESGFIWATGSIKRPEQRAVLVGNVMIDSLHWALERNGEFSLPVSGRYAVVTMHRPSNVDTAGAWASVVAAVDALESFGLEIIWPHHPRAPRDRRMREPLGYVPMVKTLSRAALVLTDSGGVQEEATALGVPCLTFRENTERPITVSRGTNTVVGTDPAAVAKHVDEILSGRYKKGQLPELWDGQAAKRIVDELEKQP